MKMYGISKKEVKKYARTYMYEMGACCWYISNEKKSCFASNLPQNELQTMELLLRCMIVHDELVALNHSKTEKECDSVKTAKLAVRDWDAFLKMIKKSCRKCLCRRWVKKIEKIDINIRKKVCRFIAEKYGNFDEWWMSRRTIQCSSACCDPMGLLFYPGVV